MGKPKRRTMMIKSSLLDDDDEDEETNNNNNNNNNNNTSINRTKSEGFAAAFSTSDDDDEDEGREWPVPTKEREWPVPTKEVNTSRATRPSYSREISAVSFGGEINAETNSYSSLNDAIAAADAADNNDDDESFDSECSSVKEQEQQQETFRPTRVNNSAAVTGRLKNEADTLPATVPARALSSATAASAVNFRSARNMASGSIVHRVTSLEATPGATEYRFAAAVAAMEDTSTVSTSVKGEGSTISSCNTFQYRKSNTASPPNSKSKSSNSGSNNNKGGGGGAQLKSGSLLKSSSYDSPPPTIAEEVTPVRTGKLYSKSNKKSKNKNKDNRLTKVSAMYDLDGDGQLDAIEQAMRDRDVNGDGQLDTAEVYKIVQEQMKSQRDFKRDRKVAAGLVCLVAILALSNFGTSWATAILSSDTVAEAESGTIQSKKTGEVMGFQDVGFTYILSALSDEEFEERRRLVEAEMEEDPDHEDHQHRRLGKKNKKNKCTCTKIAFDQGKIPERDLEELTKRCDGANTVNIMRKWRNIDGEEDESYDTICDPGTQVVREGRKKKNKHKTKVKVVDERVTFRKKGKDGKNKDISFDCKRGRGECYASGRAVLQGRGRPCEVARDYDGASECDEDLVCYRSDGKTRGTGVCTKLQRYADYEQVCRVDLGVDACVSGYACYSSINGNKLKVGQVHTGTCQRVVKRSGSGLVCDVSFGDDACINGYTCLGANGREVGRSGLGFCYISTDIETINRNNDSGGGWYKSDITGQCENDGNNKNWHELYGSAGQCCAQAMWWVSKSECAPSFF